MRTFGVCYLLALAILPAAIAQIKPDPVLMRMAPRGTVSLLGVRMDQIKSTEIYSKLVARQKLPDLDRFTRETGFDPRRDVRELLVASNSNQGQAVALARGRFHVSQFGATRTFKHGIYVIHGDERAGFCFLDDTLAAAGPLPALYAALDQWHSGAAPAIPDLIRQLESVPPSSQIWAVSMGGFNIPGSVTLKQGGTDFAQVFRGVERSEMWADLRNGVHGVIVGDVKTEADAKSLGDAARGVIGIGRLSVPEDHKELLRLWDGFHVEQSGRRLTINVQVTEDLIDRLVDLIQTNGLRPPAPVI